MTILSRLTAAAVVAAHVCVAAVPCAPVATAAPEARVSMTRAEAEQLLELARAPEPAAPHAHHHAGHQAAPNDAHAGHQAAPDDAHAGHHATPDDTHAGHHATPDDTHAGHPAHAPGHADGRAHAHAHARADAAPRPCHGPAPAKAVAAPIDEPLLFFLPACPCGCDQRAPAAGASSVRTGAGVPPTGMAAAADPPPIVPLPARVPEAPWMPSAPPDPVPRPASIC